MDWDVAWAAAKVGLKALPYATYGLLFLSALLEWWGLFGWLAGTMIVGVTIGAMVAKIQGEFAKLPLIGGCAGLVGVALHIIIRLQMWLG